jgi:uncharacterized protein YndB with AHSA1/START domain
MERRIQKHIEVKAPISRVWQALTDHKEFGEWFGVKLKAPFETGELAHGQLTYPGNVDIKFEAVVTRIEPEHHFSYTWHPYAMDPKVDYSEEHPTLVEFKLEKTHEGTKLTVTETGFGKLPVVRREKAFEMNDSGWAEQMVRIESFLKTHP